MQCYLIKIVAEVVIPGRTAEPKRKNRCSLCREEGHNARNCPTKPVEGNSSRIGATGSAKNAPVLVYGLSGAVLEDEDGIEDNQ